MPGCVMANFTLANFDKFLKRDTFYRLDLALGVNKTQKLGNTSTDVIVTTVTLHFTEFAPDFQSLQQIKSIPSECFFKSKFKNAQKQDVVFVKTALVDTQNGKIELPVTRTLEEDVTSQILFQPGMVWRNGKREWGLDANASVYVDQTNHSYSKLADETRTVFIKNGRDIQLLKLPNAVVNGRKTTLLIPTMELIRFYFSGSRYFTSNLYNGGFGKDRIKHVYLYDQDFNQEERTVYLWLQRSCKDSDSLILSRAIADPDAKSAMSHVYSSICAQKNFNSSLAYPRTSFPFKGTTNLECVGVSVKLQGTEDQFGFLVMGIETCDYDLPFDQIMIESVDSYSAGAKKTPKKPQERKKPNKNKTGDDEPPVGFTEGERPSNEIDPQELEHITNRQTKLSKIKLTKIRKASDKASDRYRKETQYDSDAENGSTALGNSKNGNNLEPWEIESRDKNQVTVPAAERLKHISEIVASIEVAEQGISVEALPCGDVDGTEPYGFYRFERPYRKSANYTWHLIDGRPRRALLLRINIGVDVVYLLEIEAREGVGHSLYLLTDLMSEPDFDPKTFLQSIAACSANNLLNDVFGVNFWGYFGIKHVSQNNDDTLMARIHKRLFEVTSQADNTEIGS